MGFHDFDQYERLLTVARKRSVETYLLVLLGGDAGLRLGEIVALERCDVDLSSRRLTVLQRSDWLGHVTVPKGGRASAADDAAAHGSPEGGAASAIASPVGPAGWIALTRDRVIEAVRGAQHVAGLAEQGVHILRHTFCSHLAMRGAPARAIQELAGHQDLTTTQRYMHLSPAALDAAIRLLDLANGDPCLVGPSERGGMLEAAGKSS